MDHLLSERNEIVIDHLLSELWKGTSREGHLGIVEWRSGGLGGEACEFDGNLLFLQYRIQCRPCVEPYPGAWIERAEGVDAVEEEVGPAVPEIVEVKDRVDVGWRVARRYPSHVGASYLKDRIGDNGPRVHRGIQEGVGGEG